MILVGLGSNLTTAQFPSSDQLLESSIKSLVGNGLIVTNRSSWFRSAPIPASDQPWFVNGVVALRTDLAPQARSEEHTSELQSLMRLSYAVFCLTKKKRTAI